MNEQTLNYYQNFLYNINYQDILHFGSIVSIQAIDENMPEKSYLYTEGFASNIIINKTFDQNNSDFDCSLFKIIPPLKYEYHNQIY